MFCGKLFSQQEIRHIVVIHQLGAQQNIKKYI